MEKDGSQENPELTELRPVHRVEQKLVMYEISPDQLAMLTERPGESVFLNLAISLLTVSISFLGTYLTNRPQTRTATDVYVIIMSVAFVGGLLAISIWFSNWRRARKARADLMERIKKGSPPKGEPVAPAPA